MTQEAIKTRKQLSLSEIRTKLKTRIKTEMKYTKK